MWHACDARTHTWWLDARSCTYILNFLHVRTYSCLQATYPLESSTYYTATTLASRQRSKCQPYGTATVRQRGLIDRLAPSTCSRGLQVKDRRPFIHGHGSMEEREWMPRGARYEREWGINKKRRASGKGVGAPTGFPWRLLNHSWPFTRKKEIHRSRDQFQARIVFKGNRKRS
jgi:hypothetical protein